MTIKQQGGIFGRNPTFNDVEVDGTLSIGGAEVPAPADTAKLNVAQTFTEIQNFSSNLGVGTTSPDESIHIKGSGHVKLLIESTGTNASIEVKADSAGDNNGHFRIAGDPTSSGGLFVYDVTAGAERARIDSSGNIKVNSGNLVIGTSGKGIDFSATSGTGTSELFSDYEEGNWTPAFDGVTVTYTTQTGTYVKIGDMVYGYCRIVVSSIDNTDGSSVSISGLPYTPAVTGNGGGTFNVGYNQTPLFNSTAADDVTGLNFSTGGSFQFSDASYQFFRRYVDLCNASGELLVSFFYRAS